MKSIDNNERANTNNEFTRYKRLFITLSCLVAFNIMVQAQTWYTLQNADVVVEGGAITKCNTNKTNWGTNNIIIPETLGGQTVISIKNDNNGVFNGKGIDSLQLPNTLKRIGDYAFYGNLLSSIKIPGNVTFIGNGAFGGNLLTSLDLSTSIDSIGNYAFKNNSLKSATIPDGVLYIGAFAFSENPIKTVTMANSVIKIEAYAFHEAPITNLTLSNNLTYIGDAAFGLSDLTNLTIPNSVTYIGKGAFTYNALTSLTIPNSVTYIGDGAFLGNDLADVTLPSGISNIGNSAFSDNELTSITIPSSVTYIGQDAFSKNHIASLTIPSNVKTIGDNAFSENGIKTLTLPNGIKSIGNYAFYKNPTTNLIIPNGVDSIGNYAFSENALTSLIISDNIAYIGDYAFSKNALTEITLPSIILHMGMAAFNNNAIVSVNGKPSNGLIYSRKGDGTEDNTKIVSYGGASDNINFIPLSVSSIGNFSFSNSKLKTIKIPYGVAHIGDFAFYYNQLTSLTIPSSIDSIKGNAFSFNLIKKLTFDTLSRVSYIGSSAFYVNQLNSLRIPNSVTFIADSAFFNNVLSSVTFQPSSSVASIKNKAFGRNSLLTSVALPNPVNKPGYTFNEWQNSNNTAVTEIADYNVSYVAKFTPTTNYKVSGAITIDRANGMSLAISGDYNGTTPANTDGTFSFSLNAGRNITIAPKREGYTFSPASINISNIQANMTGVNFTGTINTYNITFAAGNNGSITGQTAQQIEYGKTTSSVTAVANNGYRFLEWRNAANERVSIINPIIYMVTSNDAITAIFTSNVGVGNIKTAEIFCYPNPASINTTIESPILINAIEIYNSTGQKIDAMNNIASFKVILDVAKYPCGLYFVNIKGKELTQVLKLIVK